MKEGLISVVIPCYNVAPYLRRCIDSILNNTYRNLQVICINDGSTDDTLEILRSYNDERMVVVDQKNKGLSLSRNVGIEKAEGEFISFIDSDDWVHKEYYERMLDVQRKTQADIVITKIYTTNEFCDDFVISDIKFTTSNFFESNDGSMVFDAAWNKLYRTEVIGNTRFVSVFAEDQLFNSSLLITQKNAVCAVTDVAMYYYYNRPGSLMNSFHEDRMLALAKEYIKVSENVENPEVFNYIFSRGFKLGLSTRYKSMFRENLASYRKSCNEFLNETLGKMSRFPFHTRLLYSIFVKFPFLYRQYRIKMDPTMLDWERSEIESQKTK